MGRIDGRLIRRGALLVLLVGGGLLFAACAKPGQPSQGPVAVFDATPTSGNAPLPVTFTDLSTGTITGWQWDFGDTATSTTQSPTHTYDAGGTYIVALTVNGAGGTSTTSHKIIVNAPPTVAITGPANDTLFQFGDPVPFTGTASDPEDGPISSTIQWSSDKDGALGSGAAINPSSLSAGAQTVTASVTDSGGKRATASVSITVNAAPTVSITTPSNGALYQLGDAVLFTGTATDSEDGDLSAAIQWTSSLDGPLGTGASITSSLTSGTHTITASVTDSGGKTATASVSITVNAPPTVSITGPANGALYQLGDAVPFTGTAADSEDGDLSAAIQWTSSLDGPIGTGGSFSTSALSSGVHTITAAVTDSGGKTGSDSITIDVTAAPPQANFSATPTFGAAPLLVSFTDTSTGDITSRTWSFSDGGSASGQNVTHTFTEPGSYTATLSVIGPGGSSTHTGEFGVTSAPPQASFTATPSIGIAPLTVTFADTSTGAITSWNWTFSDGGSASGQDVTHTFMTPGFYTVTLEVSGPGGTSSATQSIAVASVISPGGPGGGPRPVPNPVPNPVPDPQTPPP